MHHSHSWGEGGGVEVGGWWLAANVAVEQDGSVLLHCAGVIESWWSSPLSRENPRYFHAAFLIH